MQQRHHFPSNTCTRQVMRDAYVDTLDVYGKLFGADAPVDSWPRAGSTCGDSYSGLVTQEQATVIAAQRLAA